MYINAYTCKKKSNIELNTYSSSIVHCRLPETAQTILSSLSSSSPDEIQTWLQGAGEGKQVSFTGLPSLGAYIYREDQGVALPALEKEWPGGRSLN